MKLRIAIKIMNTKVPDATRKPSEQTPYSDQQWLAAGRRHWMSLQAWKKHDPSMSSRPKWEKRPR